MTYVLRIPVSILRFIFWAFKKNSGPKKFTHEKKSRPFLAEKGTFEVLALMGWLH